MWKFVLCQKTAGGEIIEKGTLKDVVSFSYSETSNADLQKSGSIEHIEKYESGSNLVRCYNDGEVFFTLKIGNSDESLLETDSYKSTLYDTCYFLEAKKTIYKYSITAGSNVMAYIKMMCSDAGIQVKLEDKRLILSKTAVFDEGTSYLSMINDLLDICDYQHVKSDAKGYIVIEKKKKISDGFDYTITSSNTLMLTEQTKASVDEDVPNVVALVYEGELWNLTGLAYNNNTGATSLQQRGYEVTSVEKISDVGTENATQYEIQSELDRLASEKMRMLSRNSKKYNISVLMNRRYSVNDLAYIETEDGAFDLYVIESLSYDGKAGTRCNMMIATVA